MISYAHLPNSMNRFEKRNRDEVDDVTSERADWLLIHPPITALKSDVICSAQPRLLNN